MPKFRSMLLHSSSDSSSGDEVSSPPQKRGRPPVSPSKMPVYAETLPSCASTKAAPGTPPTHQAVGEARRGGVQPQKKHAPVRHSAGGLPKDPKVKWEGPAVVLIRSIPRSQRKLISERLEELGVAAGMVIGDDPVWLAESLSSNAAPNSGLSTIINSSSRTRAPCFVVCPDSGPRGILSLATELKVTPEFLEKAIGEGMVQCVSVTWASASLRLRACASEDRHLCDVVMLPVVASQTTAISLNTMEAPVSEASCATRVSRETDLSDDEPSPAPLIGAAGIENDNGSTTSSSQVQELGPPLDRIKPKLACQWSGTAMARNFNSHLTGPLEALATHYAPTGSDQWRVRAYERGSALLKSLSYKVPTYHLLSQNLLVSENPGLRSMHFCVLGRNCRAADSARGDAPWPGTREARGPRARPEDGGQVPGDH